MEGRSRCKARAALQTPPRWHLLKPHPSYRKWQNLWILRSILVQSWPIPAPFFFTPTDFGCFSSQSRGRAVAAGVSGGILAAPALSVCQSLALCHSVSLCVALCHQPGMSCSQLDGGW